MRNRHRAAVLTGSLVSSLIFLSTCRQRRESGSSVRSEPNHEVTNEFGFGLTPHQLEAAFTAQEDAMIQGLSKQILSRITTMRDAHPKAHACVYNANLTVRSDLEEIYRTGIFAISGRSIPAIVRFSHGSSRPDADDKTPSSHGMAVKLMLNDLEQQATQEIPGEVLHAPSEAPVDLITNDRGLVTKEDIYKTFDIIAINGISEFVVNDLQSYPAFFKAAATGNFGEYIASLPEKNRPIIGGLLAKLAAVKTTNLLQERYNSWVPYAFDETRAVKYSFKPCAEHNGAPVSPDDSKNFLGERLRSDLSVQQGCYKLLAHFHEQGMPDIENASYPWGAPDSRQYVELATLTLPPKFTTENFCQGLSFNPAHALPNQRGIGSTQRARRIIYAAISNARITNTRPPSASGN